MIAIQPPTHSNHVAMEYVVATKKAMPYKIICSREDIFSEISPLSHIFSFSIESEKSHINKTLSELSFSYQQLELLFVYDNDLIDVLCFWQEKIKQENIFSKEIKLELFEEGETWKTLFLKINVLEYNWEKMSAFYDNFIEINHENYHNKSTMLNIEYIFNAFI